MRNDWPAAAQLRDTPLEAESPSARSAPTPGDVKRNETLLGGCFWFDVVRPVMALNMTQRRVQLVRYVYDQCCMVTSVSHLLAVVSVPVQH